MPISLDEYPIHQAPLSMAFPASSDRNFYDRCYLNAHDRTGEIFLITGLGVYPNLGVIDAYAAVRIGDRQLSVRMSDALGDDRMKQQVGPYRIEVIEPLERFRVVCDTPGHPVAFDLTWQGSFPAVDEPPHVMRRNGKIMLEAQRFAQVGTWEGTLRVEDREIVVSPDTWVGTRDRSWGIRPVGEAEPAGRPADDPESQGLWWMYIPLRFDDFAIILIVQEEPDGTRVLNEAVRVWPQESGRRPEQLGWPDFAVTYTPGTRHPERCVVTLHSRDEGELVLDVESLGHVILSRGAGYGADPEWSHGQWRGRDWIESSIVDVSDPAVAATARFGVIDHVGRATLGGKVGWGLFEHGTIGRHDPTGFADFMSVAG